MQTGSFDPQGIIAGDHPLTHQPATILNGEGALVRGTVLGQVLLGTPTVAAKAGGNTGNGTCVLDATTPLLANAEPGTYKLRCITAGANAATFRLTSPKGRLLGDFAFSGAGASVTTDQDVKAAITDAATDFVVGDGFDITVPVGSKKWRVSKTANLDGSQTPAGILAFDADATSADAQGAAYLEGEFAQEMLTYGTGHSAATVEAAFRANSTPIYLKKVGAVA